jgi:hypothetical protein
MHEHLIGRWMHSREEDAGAAKVFRPADYSFPPARGREGFELRPDRSLVSIGYGPVDAPTESSGSWELQDDGTLVLHDPTTPSAQRYKVLAHDPDRLVLEPQ